MVSREMSPSSLHPYPQLGLFIQCRVESHILKKKKIILIVLSVTETHWTRYQVLFERILDTPPPSIIFMKSDGHGDLGNFGNCNMVKHLKS